ncbi:MAG: hypothetical protein ACRC2R_18040 [Xenococcaceae cyanobacterium]
MQEISLFQQALDAVEVLSIEDQIALIDVLGHRLQQRQRQQLLQETQEARQEYSEGKVKFGSVADFLSELDKFKNSQVNR